MDVKCVGLFFNESSIESDKEPSLELVISKDALDRSSGNIIARFEYNVESRSKLLFSVYLDGKQIDDYGTNFPFDSNGGFYDTVLFRYPNSAKANKLGTHKVRVICSIIPNIVESSEDLVDWKDATILSESNFLITLKE